MTNGTTLQTSNNDLKFVSSGEREGYYHAHLDFHHTILVFFQDECFDYIPVHNLLHSVILMLITVWYNSSLMQLSAKLRETVISGHAASVHKNSCQKPKSGFIVPNRVTLHCNRVFQIPALCFERDSRV
jgi:hypothetical protein